MLFSRLQPLVILTLLAAGIGAYAQNGPDGSVLPGADPTKPTPTPDTKPEAKTGEKPETKPQPKPEGEKPAAAGKAWVKIVALRAGREPYPWAVPGRVARSFVTNTPERLEFAAAAEVVGLPGAAADLQWEVTPPEGFALAEGTSFRGPKMVVTLRRAGGNPTSTGGPLSLTVTASTTVEGKELRQSMTLMQDLRDRLRQEYVDFQRAYVPERRELLDEEQFQRLYGKRYPSVGWGELNFTRIPGSDDRYPVIMASERLVSALHRIEREYGSSLTVSSGFRNPVRQLQVHSSVGESHHQYGRAADLYVAPDSAAPKTDRQIAWPIDWLRLAAASLRGGGSWIEPMLACHVNTAGCHVHVDVRDRGEMSRIVQLSGQVLGPDGLPLPGAEVRLAGMPARTNASGNFLLKHVLTPREYEVEVEAPGRGVVTETIHVGPTGASLTVNFPNEPQAALVATAGVLERNADGEPVLPVTVRNLGTGAALDLQLNPAPLDPDVGEGESAASGLVKRVWPAQVPNLLPGGEAQFRIALTLPPGALVEDEPLPALPFTAAYRNTKGEARTRSLTVEWRLRGAPPVPAAVSTALPSTSPADTFAVPTPAAPLPDESSRPARAALSPFTSDGLVKDIAAGLVGLSLGVLGGLIVVTMNRRSARSQPVRRATPTDTPPQPVD